MWVASLSLTLSSSLSLSHPPSHLDCYLSGSSQCVLITVGLRETQLGDEAHFVSPAAIIIVRAQLQLLQFNIHKMLFNLDPF